MKINEHMNLVVPLYGDDGETIYAYVHSAPFSAEAFEMHFYLMSKVFTEVAGKFGNMAGPRISAMLMKRLATNDDALDDYQAYQNELHRLTNVIIRGPHGWETVPFGHAVATGGIKAEDVQEVENAITFFTVAYAMYQKKMRHAVLNGAAKLWGASIVSQHCMEYAASLPTSTVTVNSGPNLGQVFSVPV